MRPRTALGCALLTLLWVTAASSGRFDTIIDGEFEIQNYLIPESVDGEGYRHITAAINDAARELIIFGGLGNGFGAGVPVNDQVFSLDLTQDPADQDWDLRNADDDEVERPWFTSTRGFIQIEDRYYLTCDDTDENAVFEFDPDTYTFSHLSTPDQPALQVGDCCAVGVKVPNNRSNEKDEERIYIVGGRTASSTPYPPERAMVRYYSITHDEWVRVSDMHVARSHMGCGTAYLRGEPLIYGIGGGKIREPNQPDRPHRSMEVYNVIDDEWTLYEDYLPEGRTRLGMQNVDDKYLLLIGGDSTCAGGSGAMCSSDQPLTTVEIIDIKNDNALVSDDVLIPQLTVPRQTPGTALRRRMGNDQDSKYKLWVIGGRTRDAMGLGVLTTTEVLSFHRIKPLP